MIELYFIIAICAIWLLFASIHDLRTRMVPNWVSFSLIVFVLGYRFFYSLFFGHGFGFFYQGVIGLGIFFVIGNLLYYGRLFAGGDAKLMIALGTALPFSQGLRDNTEIFITFIALFLVTGAVYGLLWSLFISLKNFSIFKMEFKRKLGKEKKMITAFMLFGIALMLLGFAYPLSFYAGVLAFIFPYLYIYAKVIDDSCMVREKPVSRLEEGDWISHDVKIGNSTIRANWHGLTNEDIRKIRKAYKKIKIREGIAFAPVFLISFLLLVYIYLFNFESVGSIFGKIFP